MLLSKLAPVNVAVAIIFASSFVGARQAYSASESGAADPPPKYHKYKRHSKKTKLIPLARFISAGDSLRCQLFSQDSGVVASELESSLEQLYDKSSGFEVTRDGFTLLGEFVPFASVLKTTDSVYSNPQHSSEKIVTVTFWTSAAPTSSGVKKFVASPASRIRSNEQFSIPEGGFIRGSVISFAGDVSVAGEVNHSVIVFGGNVSVSETGVVRDHVVALGGHATVASGSKVYGYILPKISGHRVRRPERPWTAEKQRLSFVPSFTYNRVDGFAPRVGWKFTDVDSALPDIKLTYGLALTSERQRYRFSARQHLFGAGGLSVTGAFYQELKSDDDALLPEWQNTLFALLTNTDYKNYYEAEGGSLGVSYEGLRQFTFSFDLYTDKLRTLRSARELWSLFGGEKRFYPNYQGIPTALTDSARAEFDGKRSAGFILTIAAHSRKAFAPRQTKWNTRLVIERALTGLDSDFSFTRYRFSGTYETYPTRSSDFIARWRLRTSDGELPLYRMFFNGGYKWLRGFDHKEFLGSKDWAVALEYGAGLKGAGLDFLKFWMFYDVGQSATTVSFSKTRLLQSLGVGLGVSDFLRLNFTRRLDVSDPSWRIAVEL